MKYIDEYIERQKELKPSPFLETRIKARLENSHIRKPSVSLWQSAAVAASVALVVMLGIAIGNSIQPVSYLPVNDNQIENLSIFVTDDHQ